MNLDMSKIISDIGDDLIAEAGEPLGLDHDQSVRVAHALAAHIGMGGEEAIKQAAADTGLDEEVIAAMLPKLIEAGKEKLLAEGPVADAIDSAKEQAMSALGSVGGAAAKSAGGMLGTLFGRK